MPFTFVFMSVSFSALYTKCRTGRRLTDLGTEGAAMVAAGTNGSITVLAGSATDLIIDVNGFFTPYASPPLPIQTFTDCVQATLSPTCTLPIGTYTISQTINVARYNVTIQGGGSTRSQTILLRGQNFTGPLMQVQAPAALPGGFTTPGVTIQNLTFCGNNGRYDPSKYVGNANNACPSSAPSAPVCNCVDLQIVNADTGLNPPTPFTSAGNSFTGPYSVTIANCAFEDAPGHAIALIPTAGLQQKVNDVYIQGSDISGSAVTGILVGANGEDYSDHKVCDNNPGFINDSSRSLPRNIRIEGNTFYNNNTGAIGMVARWVGLRNNIFTNNYISPPPPQSPAGGSVFFDQCADTIQIWGNTLTYPASTPVVNTQGLEFYGRNIDIRQNTVSGFPDGGIVGASLYNTTISNNTMIMNNQRAPYTTGGIVVSTAGPGPCDPIPRDTQTVTISGNKSTGQNYGVFFSDRFETTNTINNVTITGNDLSSNSVAAIGLAEIATLNAYSGPPTTPVFVSNTPLALAVDAVAPVSSRCSTGLQETFTFSVSDVNGSGNINWIQGIFSIPGTDEDGVGGPDPNAAGCHFYYAPPSDPMNPNTIFLDRATGGFMWDDRSSPVGTGGHALSNGFCTINAGSPSMVQTRPDNPKILDLTLNISFSSDPLHPKHIYEITENKMGQRSNLGAWKYWGYWNTP